MKFPVWRSSRGEHDEGGYTLIEVLAAVVIEALIMGALGTAFIGILKGSSQVNQSLNKSGDARIAAHYIASDAQNSSGPETSLTDTTSCPDPSPPLAGAPSAIVRFNWNSTDASAATIVNTVNYVLVSTSVLRRQCVGGVLVSDRAVASSVQSVTAVCAPTPGCAGNPSSITVTVREAADTDGSVYQYSLNASFRKLIGAGAPAVASSLIALGGGTCSGGVATGLNVAGTASLRVYGNTKINAIDAAGSPACKAMSLGGAAGNYTAGGTQFLTGGTCAATAPSTCPSSSTYSSSVADPYTGYVAPVTTGLPSQANCPSGTAQPGVYAALLTLSSTCTLASGVYVLQNGLSITGGTITSAAGGVFLYLAGGTFSQTGSAAVTLTAMTTGTYAGMVMWRAGTSAMTIANAGALTFNGALYAPGSRVPFSGSAVTTKVTSIVAQSLSLSSAATLTVGGASPLSIPSPATLPSWTVNKPLYPNTAIIGSGGDGVAYNWSATGLPAGLTINASSGVISGKPTAAGVSSVTVTVGDSSGNTVATRVYSLTINAVPTVSTATLPNGEMTLAYNTTLAVSGGTSPFTWSATGLPSGLALNSSTGAITGTPTGTSGTATVAVSLTDAAGATASASLSLTVFDAVLVTTTSPLPAGEKTIAYSATVVASGGKTPYAWSVTSGMPAGLSINATTGVISGTPTTAATSTVVVRAVDALGGIDTENLSLTINPQPTISSVVLTNGSGSTAGTIEKNDTIAITFSALMSETTMCSAWTGGDSTAQLINANSNVTVSISDGTGATNDALTVTSTSCTFNFGSINLGSNAYVSAATSFGGTGTNVSSITWTPSTRVLLITLGAKIAGTVANVSTSTPIYTANTALRDSVGAALSNSPFTLPAGKKF